MAREIRRAALFTSSGYVLLAIAAQPDITVREIASRVGITERATYSVLRQLEAAGYVRRGRDGARALTLVLDASLEHPMLEGRTLGDLVAALRQGTTNVGAAGHKTRR